MRMCWTSPCSLKRENIKASQAKVREKRRCDVVMIHECTNVLQTALLLTVHFNSALLRVHNQYSGTPYFRRLKLDDPIAPSIFCAWRKHFNRQVRSACHALSSGDFRLPCLADIDQVRDDPASSLKITPGPGITIPKDYGQDRSQGPSGGCNDALVGMPGAPDTKSSPSITS